METFSSLQKCLGESVLPKQRQMLTPTFFMVMEDIFPMVFMGLAILTMAFPMHMVFMPTQAARTILGSQYPVHKSSRRSILIVSDRFYPFTCPSALNVQ